MIIICQTNTPQKIELSLLLIEPYSYLNPTPSVGLSMQCYTVCSTHCFREEPLWLPEAFQAYPAAHPLWVENKPFAHALV